MKADLNEAERMAAFYLKERQMGMYSALSVFGPRGFAIIGDNPMYNGVDPRVNKNEKFM